MNILLFVSSRWVQSRLPQTGPSENRTGFFSVITVIPDVGLLILMARKYFLSTTHTHTLVVHVCVALDFGTGAVTCGTVVRASISGSRGPSVAFREPLGITYSILTPD
jgi:hypothetical protein